MGRLTVEMTKAQIIIKIGITAGNVQQASQNIYNLQLAASGGLFTPPGTDAVADRFFRPA
jgi:hypothetical protein